MTWGTRLRRIALWFNILVGVLILVLALLLFNPFSQPPPIGRDLPSRLSEAREVFDARVKAEWPLPIAEEALIAELEAMGFKVGPRYPDGLRIASFTKGRLLCNQSWSVRWTVSGGMVGALFGTRGATCL